MSLKEQLAEYRAGWYQRVPAERQAVMQRHIDELRSGTIPHTLLKAGASKHDQDGREFGAGRITDRCGGTSALLPKES